MLRKVYQKVRLGNIEVEVALKCNLPMTIHPVVVEDAVKDGALEIGKAVMKIGADWEAQQAQQRKDNAEQFK